jgi:hypothetical protein
MLNTHKDDLHIYLPNPKPTYHLGYMTVAARLTLKVSLQDEILCECVEWVKLAQNSVKFRVFF